MHLIFMQFVARALAKPQAVRSTAREQVAVGRVEQKMCSINKKSRRCFFYGQDFL